MSTGDQYPPSPEEQPQYPTNPYQQQPQQPQYPPQQQPQYPPNPYQQQPQQPQQPQYPMNPYQQPPQNPYPGQPIQGQPYPSQPTYPSQPMYGAPPAGQGGNSNRTLFIVIGSIVGVVVLGCCALFGLAAVANRGANSNLGSQGGSQSTATISATANTGSTTTSSNQHYKVGDVVAASDTFTVTVNSVTTSQGDDVFKPDAGNTYLIVDVTVKNTSSQEQDVSSLLQFSLEDSTGQQYNETFFTEGSPPDGKVEAGDQIKGQISYEVPQSQHDFIFSFQADILSSGQTLWDLHI